MASHCTESALSGIRLITVRSSIAVPTTGGVPEKFTRTRRTRPPIVSCMPRKIVPCIVASEKSVTTTRGPMSEVPEGRGSVIGAPVGVPVAPTTTAWNDDGWPHATST